MSNSKIVVKREIRVVCVQHPNGECWIAEQGYIPNHWKILGEKMVTVEFEVDLGYDPERAYPEGRISTLNH